VIIRGSDKESQHWANSMSKDYAPNRLVLTIPQETPNLPGTLADYEAPEKGVVAYVCREGACLAPVTELSELEKLFCGE
jgi:uncharacterized protein YyaL (SSP411 family)